MWNDFSKIFSVPGRKCKYLRSPGITAVPVTLLLLFEKVNNLTSFSLSIFFKKAPGVSSPRAYRHYREQAQEAAALICAEEYAFKTDLVRKKV